MRLSFKNWTDTFGILSFISISVRNTSWCCL